MTTWIIDAGMMTAWMDGSWKNNDCLDYSGWNNEFLRFQLTE